MKNQRKQVDNRPIMVAIRCITYNHEPYIRQCLEGFVMQKTNFRFVAIVHDDASTDGTAAIIREYEEKYPDIIKPIYEIENQYSKRDGSLGRIMNAAFEVTGCKYIAYCEGDDYWTDPLKLQKQVDILESYPECSLTLSNGYINNVARRRRMSLINPYGNINSGFIDINTILTKERVLVPTASMMCRKEYYMDKPLFFRQAPVGDKPLRMWCMINGCVYYHAEPMIAYNVGVSGSFGERISSNTEYAKYIYDSMEVFYNKFNEYTNNKYFDEITYCKNWEYYVYCVRISDYNSMFKCPHFKLLPIKTKIKNYIKYVVHKIIK